VQLTDGENRMSGQRFTVDLATGGWRIETTGAERVQTVINPPAR
jgi:lipopolysaccharide export system protein LptA